MKKLFCVLSVFVVVALCFGMMSASATKEQDEQILAAEPTATATATATDEPQPIGFYGDANSDGVVNMKDVLIIRKYLADLDVEMDQTLADANRDGELNMKDVLVVRKYLADLGDLEKIYVDKHAINPETLHKEFSPVDFKVEKEFTFMGYYLSEPYNWDPDEEVAFYSPIELKSYFAGLQEVVSREDLAQFDAAFFENRFLITASLDFSILKGFPDVTKGTDGVLKVCFDTHAPVPAGAYDYFLISLPNEMCGSFDKIETVLKGTEDWEWGK